MNAPYALHPHQARSGLSVEYPIGSRSADRFRWTFQLLAVPFLAVALRIASPPTSALSYLVIAGYAFAGRRQAIISLFLLWLFNMISHDFCGPPLYAAVLRHVVVLAAAMSVVIQGVSRNAVTKRAGILWATVAMLGLMLLHSVSISQMPEISVLKVFMFATAILASLGGWGGMDEDERRTTAQMIVGGLILLSLASLVILVAFPGRAFYGTNTSLFKGALYHSQVFGPTMGFLAAALTLQCLTIRPISLWRAVVLLISAYLMVRSSARVGVVAYLGGVLAGFGYAIASSLVVRYRHHPRIVVTRLVVATLLMMVLIIFAGDRISKGVREFIAKAAIDEDGDISLLEAGMKSRGAKLEELVANIRRSPLTGIGFGVSSSAEDRKNIVRDGILGLPIMATVEKGILPLAIVEELGIPMATIVFLWIAMLILLSTRGGMLTVAVISACLMSNIAEAALFSPGGTGLLQLVLVGWAVMAPVGGRDRQQRDQRRAAEARSFERPLPPLHSLPVQQHIGHALPH